LQSAQALPDNGLFGAIAGKNPYPQLKLHQFAASEGAPPALPGRRFRCACPEEIST
jgi:hypothetical protein